MGDLYDLSVNIQHMVKTIELVGYNLSSDDDKESSDVTEVPAEQRTWYQSMRSAKSPRPIDQRFLEVRQGICITGFHNRALLTVKKMMHSLIPDQLISLESFHVKKQSDINDGALLVPKIVLVAMHCPGRKLLDEDGNEGQLDFLYDEACDLGADVCVVYMGLPASVYPPFRQMTYHPKMAETLFPSQPVLKELAEQSCLITVTEGTDFTTMQKNAIREWILKPVGKHHPIFKAAEYLSSAEFSINEVDFYSEPESRFRGEESRLSLAAESAPVAEEHHPLAEVMEKKRKKKSRRSKSFFGGIRRAQVSKQQRSLTATADDDQDDVELELYNAGGYGTYSNYDTLSNLSI